MSHQKQLPRLRPVRILAGDIGATHSRLAIYAHEEGGLELVRRETYSSSEHDGVTEVLESFLTTEQENVDAVCLGLPAPIHSGVVFPLTNLSWEVDRDGVRRAVGTDRVTLVNDVEASAAGIAGVLPEDLICLQAGHVDPSGNRVVASVGTGLGVSALTPSGYTFATEAGHMTFSPSRDPDFALNEELLLEYGHVSWERVASGSAIPRIHAVLSGERASQLSGPEIVRRYGTDPICRKSVETFKRYLGSAVGNIALALMPSGGLYLAGGVAAKVLHEESTGHFLEAFLDKGRMRRLLEKIPVFVVKEGNLALRGAARKAIALLGPH